MHEPMESILTKSAQEAARELLGCILERTIDGSITRVRIVETEAYDQTDEASHSFRGQTKRTEVMFGEPGFLYVYFTYGMHYCCNIVVGEKGYGAAVLIRAVEPIDGVELLQVNRKDKHGAELTNGPAKLCQALAINKQLNGHDLRHKPLRLLLIRPTSIGEVVQTARIGISKAKDKPWRFYIKDNPYVSKKV